MVIGSGSVCFCGSRCKSVSWLGLSDFGSVQDVDLDLALVFFLSGSWSEARSEVDTFRTFT